MVTILCEFKSCKDHSLSKKFILFSVAFSRIHNLHANYIATHPLQVSEAKIDKLVGNEPFLNVERLCIFCSCTYVKITNKNILFNKDVLN